jgi:hypothetical protein
MLLGSLLLYAATVPLAAQQDSPAQLRPPATPLIVHDFYFSIWSNTYTLTEGPTRHDIVRTSCYLRDIDRDYEVFNEERNAFFREQGLDPLPASTGIQAKLCRPELLVEIEAIAMFQTAGSSDAASEAGQFPHLQNRQAPTGE